MPPSSFRQSIPPRSFRERSDSVAQPCHTPAQPETTMKTSSWSPSRTARPTVPPRSSSHDRVPQSQFQRHRIEFSSSANRARTNPEDIINAKYTSPGFSEPTNLAQYSASIRHNQEVVVQRRTTGRQREHQDRAEQIKRYMETQRQRYFEQPEENERYGYRRDRESLRAGERRRKPERRSDISSGVRERSDGSCCVIAFPPVLRYTLENSTIDLSEMKVPRVLIIAGSDSSGGAGLEADQKVLAAHGCYAMTATTALTAQNTLGVEDIYVIPPDFVSKQIKACLDDVGADVVKIGMLASAPTINAVADAVIHRDLKHIVLDPVMVATSGAQLLPSDAVRVLREKLLPITSVLTPNIPEAILLLRDADVHFQSPNSLYDLETLARSVHQLGPKAVLLKGGHIPLTKSHTRAQSEQDSSIIVDILFDGNEFTTIESGYLKSRNTHGTGCSLASAISANLSRNQTLPNAVRNACRYIEVGIKTSKDLGSGNGPINHFHSLQILPFASSHFVEYLLARDDVNSLWTDFTRHKFVQQMANGTLPIGLFKSYIIQDYMYLTQFARTNALAGYKSMSMDVIAASAQIVLHIQHEMKLHLEYCGEFGLSKEEIESHKESQACVAYSRWMLDIGQSQDWLALQMALASCLIGYNVAARIVYDAKDSKREGNPYWKWVENYVADDYQEAVKKGSELLETYMVKQSPSRIDELVQIFIRATEMEIGFWEFEAHVE